MAQSLANAGHGCGPTGSEDSQHTLELREESSPVSKGKGRASCDDTLKYAQVASSRCVIADDRRLKSD
jgi:hypothetical protein